MAARAARAALAHELRDAHVGYLALGRRRTRLGLALRGGEVLLGHLRVVGVYQRSGLSESSPRLASAAVGLAGRVPRRHPRYQNATPPSARAAPRWPAVRQAEAPSNGMARFVMWRLRRACSRRHGQRCVPEGARATAASRPGPRRGASRLPAASARGDGPLPGRPGTPGHLPRGGPRAQSAWGGVAPQRRERVRGLPRLRDPLPRLRPRSLRRVRERAPCGLLLQGQRNLSVVQRPPHARHGSAPGRSSVPARSGHPQWVLSLPFQVRFLLARRGALRRAVLKIFLRAPGNAGRQASGAGAAAP